MCRWKNLFSVLVLVVGGWTLSSPAGESSGAATPTFPSPLVGSWGGDHVGMEITAKGAKLEYDCAHGEIREPIRPDKTGAFDARGFHVREHGGPIHPGEHEDRHPARYVGVVDALSQNLTYTVVLTDSGESAGTYHVQFGASPRIMKCL